MAITIKSAKLCVHQGNAHGEGGYREYNGTFQWGAADQNAVLLLPAFLRLEGVQLTPISAAAVPASDLPSAQVVPNGDGSLPLASGGVVVGRTANTAGATYVSYRAVGR